MSTNSRGNGGFWQTIYDAGGGLGGGGFGSDSLLTDPSGRSLGAPDPAGFLNQNPLGDLAGWFDPYASFGAPMDQSRGVPGNFTGGGQLPPTPSQSVQGRPGVISEMPTNNYQNTGGNGWRNGFIDWLDPTTGGIFGGIGGSPGGPPRFIPPGGAMQQPYSPPLPQYIPQVPGGNTGATPPINPNDPIGGDPQQPAQNQQQMNQAQLAALLGSGAAGLGAASVAQQPQNNGNAVTLRNSTEPWAPLQPYIATDPGGYVPQAGALYASGSPMSSGLTDLERQGITSQMQGAQGAAGQLQGDVLAAQQFGLGGSLTADYEKAIREGLGAADVGNNPYVQGMMDTNSRNLNQNLQENVLPSLRRGYAGSGQYGSSRQAIAEGLAARGTQEAIGDQNSNILLNSYNQGINARGQTLGQGLDLTTRALTLAPQTYQTSLFPGQVQQGAGQTYRRDTDRALMEPYNRLGAYAGTVQGAQGVGSQGMSQSPYEQSSPLLGALGGGLIGSGIGSSIGGSLFGVPASVLGAGAGGLLGAFL